MKNDLDTIVATALTGMVIGVFITLISISLHFNDKCSICNENGMVNVIHGENRTTFRVCDKCAYELLKDNVWGEKANISAH